MSARVRLVAVDAALPERAVRQRTAAGYALRDIADAASFLEAQGLLLQTPDPWLPSLFAAAQGQPAKPGAGGFGQWPAHAWSWAGELAERQDVLLTKVVLGKRTLVHARLWPALDAAVRGRVAEDADGRAIQDALERHGALYADELRRQADLDVPARRQRFQKALARLEALGVVVARPVLLEPHQHVALVELWTRRFPRPLAPAGVCEFVHATVAAAGRAPVREVLRWFAWPRAEVERALEELVASQRLLELEPGSAA